MPRTKHFWKHTATASLALLMTTLGVTSQAFSKKPAIQTPRLGIAAVHHGDIWIAVGEGHSPQQVTHSGLFQNVSVENGVVAAVNDAQGEDSKTNVYIRRPPAQSAQAVTQAGYFAGVPFWLPGTRNLLVGRLKPNADADGGLWLINTASGATRRVLPDYDADFPVNNHLLLSPSGTRIVSTNFSAVQIMAAKTLAPLAPPVAHNLQGVTDIAWLDDNTLLLCGPAGVDNYFSVPGGIRAFDLRTRHLRPWLYSASTDVQRLVRAPHGNLFAVGLGHAGNGSQHIRIFNARTKTGYALSLPASTQVCAFSDNASQLLVLIPSSTGKNTRDAYAVDLKTKTRRLVMPDVTDAVWL